MLSNQNRGKLRNAREVIKVNIVAVSFLLSACSVAADDAGTKSSLATALELWQPVSVAVKGPKATIRTKEDRVTEQIYLAMMGGVCLRTLSAPGTLSQLSEISILNRHAAQGYVFEGGETECKEYVKLPVDKTKLWVLGRTHLK